MRGVVLASIGDLSWLCSLEGAKTKHVRDLRPYRICAGGAVEYDRRYGQVNIL